MDEDPEGYAITTSHLPDTTIATTAESCTPCETPWIWIILFIIFLLVAIGLAIWLIWKYHHDSTNCSGCTGPGVPISFDNPYITVDNPNQITGTWTTTDPGVIVTLFATLNPPKFNSSGGLDNVSAQTNFKQAPPATGATGGTGVTGTVSSVSLPNLTAGVKYYATLIARHGATNNYKSFTQIVYMQDGNIQTNVAGVTGNNTFELQDILQVGAIQLTSDVADANGFYTVEFNQRPRQTRDLFYFNSRSQLQLDGNNVTGLSDLCLFNNAGNLVVANCTKGITGTIANNSYWTYNPSQAHSANKLCLKNTLDNANPTCLKLTGLGSGTGTLSISDQTTAGDAWAPAFVNNQ